MTLPQPTGMRLLPRSPYRLRRRGREKAGGCQLLQFAAGLTRPDGTSARVLRGSGPVETTHPQNANSTTRTPVRQSQIRKLDAAGDESPTAAALGVGELAFDVAPRVALGDLASAVVKLLAARQA